MVYVCDYLFNCVQCNRTVSLDALHSQIFHEPKKLAVIGAGCSVATEPTAEISHYYNITQVCTNIEYLLIYDIHCILFDMNVHGRSKQSGRSGFHLTTFQHLCGCGNHF